MRAGTPSTGRLKKVSLGSAPLPPAVGRILDPLLVYDNLNLGRRIDPVWPEPEWRAKVNIFVMFLDNHSPNCSARRGRSLVKTYICFSLIFSLWSSTQWTWGIEEDKTSISNKKLTAVILSSHYLIDHCYVSTPQNNFCRLVMEKMQ